MTNKTFKFKYMLPFTLNIPKFCCAIDKEKTTGFPCEFHCILRRFDFCCYVRRVLDQMKWIRGAGGCFHEFTYCDNEIILDLQLLLWFFRDDCNIDTDNPLGMPFRFN